MTLFGKVSSLTSTCKSHWIYPHHALMMISSELQIRFLSRSPISKIAFRVCLCIFNLWHYLGDSHEVSFSQFIGRGRRRAMYDWSSADINEWLKLGFDWTFLMKLNHHVFPKKKRLSFNLFIQNIKWTIPMKINME